MPYINRAFNIMILLWALGLAAAAVPTAGDSSQTVCKLVVRGYGGISSAKTGVAWAMMECLPRGQQPVPIIIDKTHLGKFAPSFQGVRLTTEQETPCLVKGKADALLSFCGNQQLLFEHPVIEGIMMDHPKDNTSDWDPALLFFGGSVNVMFSMGRLQHNIGRPVLQVRHNASVMLHQTVIGYNRVHRGSSCLELGDHARLALNGSQLVGNMAEAAAGGLFASQHAAVVLASGSVCSNNTAMDAMGGCMRLQKDATAIIDHSSKVTDNRANRGGGVALRDRAALLVQGVISGNEAILPATGNNGGGVLLVGNARVLFDHGSHLDANKAAGIGGGVALFDSAYAAFTTGSSCLNNAALDSGGCIAATDNSTVLAEGSIYGNEAIAGGGAALGSNATMHLYGCMLNNAAAVGGGLFCTDSAHAAIGQCAVFMHNRAGKLGPNNATSKVPMEPGGGAVAVSGQRATLGLRSCAFIDNNTASSIAGGLMFYGNAPVIGCRKSLAECVELCSRRQQAPACYQSIWQPASVHALFAATCPKHTPLSSTGSQHTNALPLLHGGIGTGSKAWGSLPGLVIVGNEADVGGGINHIRYVVDDASTTTSLIANATIICNTGRTTGGGVFTGGTRAAIVMSNTVLACNKATFGAGMVVAGESSATCSGTTVIAHNMATGGRSYAGGVDVLGALVLKDQAVVEHNDAPFYGGGIALEFTASLKLEGEAEVRYNKAGTGGGLAFANWIGLHFESYDVFKSVHDNEADTAKNIYLPPRKFTTMLVGSDGYLSQVNKTSVFNTVSRVPRDQGLMHLAVRVASHNDLPVAGALVRITLGTNELLGGFRKTNESGVADFYDLKLRAPPGLYNITIAPLDWFFSPKPMHMLVSVRGCLPGEVTQGLRDACEPCPQGRYSLDPTNASCDACPEGALCPGRGTLLPSPGFFHSSDQSSQFHRCPNPLACAPQPGVPCAEGYSGNLCGSCAANWGMTTLFKCRRCLSMATIIGLYIAACVVMLALVQLLAHLTLLQNIKAAQAGAGQQLAPSTAAAAGTVALEAADVLKSLVMYAQYLVIIGSMKITWPKSLSYPLQAVQWLWSSASSETLAMECLLRQGAMAGRLPIPIQRFLMHLLAPCAIFAVIVLCKLVLIPALRYFCLNWCSCDPTVGRRGGRRGTGVYPQCCSLVVASWRMLCRCVCACCHSMTALPGVQVSRRCSCAVLGMVTLFTFLPSLSTAVLGMLVCRKIDDPNSPLPYRYTAAANGSFFAYDLQQPCMQGYHRAWMALIVPCAVLLCVLLPAGIAVLMWRKRTKLDAPDTCHMYGFLYRNYRPLMCAWEAVAVVQTNVLVAVAVFGLALGGFYQALVMNAALAVMVVLLLVFQPYRCQQLYRLRLIGLQLLLLTSYASLSFMDITYQNLHLDLDVYGLAMGAVVLVFNLLYVLFCIGLLCRSIKWLQPLKACISRRLGAPPVTASPTGKLHAQQHPAA